MSYVHNTLTEGEKIVYRAKLHWIIFLPSILIVLFLVIFVLVLESGLKQVMDLGILRLTIVIVAILLGAANFMRIKSSEFAITSDRVVAKHGIIGMKTKEILLSQVEAIELDQNLIGHFLNFGTIIVIGTGGSKSQLNDVQNPIGFRKAIVDELNKS